MVFRVGAAAALLGVPLAELQNCRVPLAELWGSSASELHERPLAAGRPVAKLDAVEQVLAARLGRIAHRPHPVAGSAAAQIARCPERYRIAELSGTLGFSARRLEQVFRTELGLTPKAVSAPAPVPSGTGPDRPRRRDRLGGIRVGARLLRPVAFHRRVPRALRPDALGLPRLPGNGPEPRPHRGVGISPSSKTRACPSLDTAIDQD